MPCRWRVLACASLILNITAIPAAAEMARGVVYEDTNGSGTRDATEPGLERMLISNGRDVVATDAEGRYEIEVDDDDFIFIIKPRDWMVPVDARGIPRFFYHHCPAGAPALKYPGVAPTGPLPASIDFPLTRHPEPDTIRVILFGDPQPSTIDQVNDFARDIAPDVIAELADPASPAFGAAFGMTLGDIVHDDLSLYQPLAEVMSTVGLPWFTVPGNHDLNYDAPDDARSLAHFHSVFGPSTYAFQWGRTTFFVIDDVVYEGPKPDGSDGPYHAEFTADQLAFIRGVMGEADPGFMVFTMHIPLVDVRNRKDFLWIVGDRPAVSIGSHWHRHADRWLGVDGEPVPEGSAHPGHHVIVQAATCGSWWQGAHDEFGIPHSTMRDGAPNGWSVLEITRLGYEVRFKGARKEWSMQMHIWAPDEVDARMRMLHEVIVNVHAGSEQSIVEMRVSTPGTGEATPWIAMEQFRGVDPYWARMKELEQTDLKQTGSNLTNANAEGLLWRATFPPGLPRGGHLIEVRTTDQYGNVYTERHIVRVTDGSR